MTSPAAPILSAQQYLVIFEVLRLNPTAENEPIRTEISAYLTRQKLWQEDAKARKTGTPW